MYYVTFIGDSINNLNSNRCEIAIRAVCVGNGKWLLEKDHSKKEKERIENRFDKEVISKLEFFTKIKVTKDN